MSSEQLSGELLSSFLHPRHNTCICILHFVSKRLAVHMPKIAEGKKTMSLSHVILKYVGSLLLCAVIYNCVSLISFDDFLISFDIYLYSLVTFSVLFKRMGRFHLDIIYKI